MKEKFDRNQAHVNIGEIGKITNETLEEKIVRIKRLKQMFAGAIVDPTVKEGITAILDESLKGLEQQSILEEEQITHHR